MANTVVQIRIDENLKEEVTSIFDQLGLDLPTAVRIFFKKTVAEGGIPFDMKVSNTQYVSNKGVEVLKSLRQEAEENGLCDMTLDEINAEIKASREERASKK